MFIFRAARSSSGRTPGSGPGNLGSNPSLAALKGNEVIGFLALVRQPGMALNQLQSSKVVDSPSK